MTTVLTACALHAPQPAAPAAHSGIDFQYMDTQVPAQQDFYAHVNGKWLKSAEIPADKPSYGAFYKVIDDTREQLRTLIDAALKQPHDKLDPGTRKVVDFYASYMDTARIEQVGLEPLRPLLARIAALRDKAGLPALVAELQQVGVTVPFMTSVQQDAKDSSRYIVEFDQDGLGLPDRDYYLKDDARFVKDRGLYVKHVETMLGLAGDLRAAEDAAAIMAFETTLAKAQWARVDTRDATKVYNPIAPAKFASLAPGFGWEAYLKAVGVPPQDFIVVAEPDYLTGFAAALDKAPLATLKAYFTWHVISDYANNLSAAFEDSHFAFYGTVLQGTPEQLPRWQRALRAVDSGIGFALGKMYVAKYFPPAYKARMDTLVENLRAAFKVSIENSTWMDATTQARALDKLAKFEPKIGYPAKWRDYSKLDIAADDLVGNVMRANRFEFRRNLAHLGHPVDRSEWYMTPQTVNAYYSPATNQIVFPAAILQPPFFDPNADEAVNYGAIGAVIGHEMSHGFDDQGAKYDGDGNLHDWWTPATLAHFKTLTKALIAQYDAYAPLPGVHVNGALTVGENIADNAGVHIAYKAYHMALGNTPAPVIDGLTGDQRFFIGWAQAWRSKRRASYEKMLITVDPHSPPQFRTNGVMSDVKAFYKAFDVQPGNGMYRPEKDRVSLY
ncbi:MAG: M13 family peptidase [Nevskiaceae bacterium]|nr:MAG: M13 family peptidase [Nevskiaceae bacterium]TBR71315.1 MAG: M13 family peptidase [Nevskiaceae bacterium]